jgi:hypothetical protein
MKKCFAIVALFICVGFSSLAQSETDDQSNNSRSMVQKPSRDFLMLKFNYNGWANSPDTIKTKGLGRGFEGSLSYDFPIKKSHFSFAVGIGVSVSNIYLDNQTIAVKDTGSAAVARFIPETDVDYKRYKLTTTYLQMPLELRFFGNNKNRNRGFKAAIGANINLLVGAHTKGATSVSSAKINDKVDTRRFLQPWTFAPTMRIGYGNFSLYASYNIVPIFKEKSGPQMLPYSIGICLTGL